MANEIILSASLRHVPTNLNPKIARLGIDQSDTGISSGVITSSTSSASTIDLTNVTNPGIAYLVNQSTEYDIEVGIEVSSTFYPMLQIRPGHFQILDLDQNVKSTNALQIKGVTNPADLFYIVFGR